MLESDHIEQTIKRNEYLWSGFYVKSPVVCEIVRSWFPLQLAAKWRCLWSCLPKDLATAIPCHPLPSPTIPDHSLEFPYNPLSFFTILLDFLGFLGIRHNSLGFLSFSYHHYIVILVSFTQDYIHITFLFPKLCSRHFYSKRIFS